MKEKQYLVKKIPIPRCSRCENIHSWVRKRFNTSLFLGFLIGAILGILMLTLFIRDPKSLESGVLMFVIFLFLGIGLGFGFLLALTTLRLIKKKKYPEELFGESKIKSYEGKSLKKHPMVEEFFNKGYEFGNKSQKV
ncbi:MAG: hypothetical protein GF421_05880 [Candidatus Aminicenantes bacterium]|nr:hypothetical protein [Candidatus Aminicenantes bacterium]